MKFKQAFEGSEQYFIGEIIIALIIGIVIGVCVSVVAVGSDASIITSAVLGIISGFIIFIFALVAKTRNA